MRAVVIRLPFVDLAITVRRTRRGRAMFWFVLFSALFHFLAVSTLLELLGRSVFSPAPHHPSEIVAISSTLRIEHRARPVPARNPAPQPRAVVAQPHRAASPARTREAAKPRPVRKIQARRPELSKVAYTGTPLTAQEIQTQAKSFEQTIAAAKAANDPVAGAATDSLTPEAPKRYTLNVNGTLGKPQPQGILFPLKRWTEGAFVCYYVRYTAEYADGASETGIVPWPISFPLNADPFAHGRHRMPLPGPTSDYVATSDVQMSPLVKNCYDHRYSYCPIAHE